MNVDGIHGLTTLTGGINAAKKNLETKFKLISGRMLEFLDSPCECSDEGLLVYVKAMHATGGLSHMVKYYQKERKETVQDILDTLKPFDYSPPAQGSNCVACSWDFNSHVARALHDIEKNFEGLCLDCIKSQRYRERHEGYDSGCRAMHQEPTWWYTMISSDQPNNFEVQDRVERLREGGRAGNYRGRSYGGKVYRGRC
jgi:hypothetical protein